MLIFEGLENRSKQDQIDNFLFQLFYQIKKVLKSNAFFGRTDLEIHLKNFLLPDTKEMLKGKGIIEIIEAQMLLGGIPKYLDLVREKPSIRIGIEELAFTETGYLVDEYERIFLSHFGKNPEYEKIVRVLAGQAYGLFRQKVSEVAGVDLGGGLTSHLKNLESAGFISSATPFHKGHNSRLLKYFLSDAYLRFYFSFVQPNLKKIKSGIQTDLFGKVAQSGAFSGWMGRSFEYLCIEHAAKISEMLGFSGIRQSRRSWSPAVIQPVTLLHAVISTESSNPKNSFKYPFLKLPFLWIHRS